MQLWTEIGPPDRSLRRTALFINALTSFDGRAEMPQHPVCAFL
jgi:hypothetical protein